MMLTPFVAAALAATGGIAYISRVRPWYHRWGATDDEIARAMPLDERIRDPSICTTMAITINAPAADIWPWLAQIGDPPRAGYYSYTWIERLVGMHVRNADYILPECQAIEVGQVLDKNGTMVVQAIDPGRSLVLGPPDSAGPLRCTWAFALYPIDAQSTRLVTRVRVLWSQREIMKQTPPYLWPMWLMIDPGAFIMERKMLREIKKRAERARRREQSDASAIRNVIARMEAHEPTGVPV
jgi:hypothetical protein